MSHQRRSTCPSMMRLLEFFQRVVECIPFVTSLPLNKKKTTLKREGGKKESKE